MIFCGENEKFFINKGMNFLLVRSPCYELNSNSTLQENVWYELEGEISPCVFVFENSSPVFVDLALCKTQFKNLIAHSKTNKKEDVSTGKAQNPTLETNNSCNLHPNMFCFSYLGNFYYIIHPTNQFCPSFASVKFQNRIYTIVTGQTLFISADGECILSCEVENITFSREQGMSNHLVLFFEGKRKFFVLIKDKQLVYSSYYDEINSSENELYLMNRLNDSLNHGRVYHLNNGKTEDYLVYLDDYEMHLKCDFTPFVFLDCVHAENYNYASQLLIEDLRPRSPKSIADFFPDFDYFLPIKENTVCLIKQHKCSIVRFELEQNQISNITIEETN